MGKHQEMKLSGSKAELPCQRMIAGSTPVSAGVHPIGMVACFISEICSWGVSRPGTDRFSLFSKALREKTEILPAWEKSAAVNNPSTTFRKFLYQKDFPVNY